MAKAKVQPPRNRLASLLLANAYAFEAHRGLRALLEDLLGMWGVRPRPTHGSELKDVVPQLVETYSRCVDAEPPFSDILGSCYMELATRGQKQWLGQYFSPAGLCDMNAAMLIDRLEPDRLTRIADPACGSGAMLLAACRRVLAVFGVDGLRRISITGIDLDATCADMAAVQLLANCNVHEVRLGEVRILRGNALDDPDKLHLVVHATAKPLPKDSSGAELQLETVETADAV